mmetsp:Transcript_52793/g.140936  ORF Transcript_52793/g.140936 Transcript_52793/m.140936 type:complete len:99 (+) Transcript_52793:709-1005(+)
MRGSTWPKVGVWPKITPWRKKWPSAPFLWDVLRVAESWEMSLLFSAAPVANTSPASRCLLTVDCTWAKNEVLEWMRKASILVHPNARARDVVGLHTLN